MKDLRKICFILFALVALEPLKAIPGQVPHPADAGFSFDVYGDSRSMMYLPVQSRPGSGSSPAYG